MGRNACATRAAQADFLASMKQKRVFIFLGITAPYLISYFQRSAPAVVGPEIAADLGLAPASLGLLVSMYAWGYAAAQLPAGILADTWGGRKTISVFVLTAAVGGIIFALSSSFFLLSLGRFLVGLGVGFVYVPAVRIMTDWYRPDELATYSGLLLGLGSIGALASATPLVLLMQDMGWRNAFLLVAAVTVLAGLVCWLVVRDTPAAWGLPAPEGTLSRKAPPVPAVRLPEALLAVFSNGRFYLLGILLFCYYGTLLSVGSLWAGPYLQHVYGFSKQTAGNIVMMVPLGLLVGCPLAGYLSDKIVKSRKRVLMGGALLHLLAYVPLAFMAGELSTGLLYALFLWYGVTGGGFVINYACAKETVAPRFAGTALGSVNIFLFLGGAFFQAVMGVVIGWYPVVSEGVYSVHAYKTGMLVAAVGLAAGVAAFVFFREKPVRE